MQDKDMLKEEESEKEVVSKNFIEMEIEKDLETGRYQTVKPDFLRSLTDICT